MKLQLARNKKAANAAFLDDKSVIRTFVQHLQLGMFRLPLRPC